MCYFKYPDGCRILPYVNCPADCEFRKTEEEIIKGCERAREILKRKGLRPYVNEEKEIMTTRRIDK